MKTLYLARHAKSDWSQPNLADFDRPLNARGQRNAPLMGRILRMANVLPDLIISSPAKRAFATASILASEMGYARENIQKEKRLYEATSTTLATLIRLQDDSYQSIMLVGHNPGLTEFANQLSEFKTDNIPTCGIFCVTFSNWQQVLQEEGQFLFFKYPKQFE